MQKYFVLIFYCTFHEILLLLIVEGGVINFDALHQLLYLLCLVLVYKTRSFCDLLTEEHTVQLVQICNASWLNP